MKYLPLVGKRDRVCAQLRCTWRQLRARGGIDEALEEPPRQASVITGTRYRWACIRVSAAGFGAGTTARLVSTEVELRVPRDVVPRVTPISGVRRADGAGYRRERRGPPDRCGQAVEDRQVKNLVEVWQQVAPGGHGVTGIDLNPPVGSSHGGTERVRAQVANTAWAIVAVPRAAILGCSRTLQTDDDLVASYRGGRQRSGESRPGWDRRGSGRGASDVTRPRPNRTGRESSTPTSARMRWVITCCLGPLAVRQRDRRGRS